jgi:hypothetical protein
MKILNMAHGSLYALGAYVAATLVGAWFNSGLNPYGSFALLALSAIVVGLVAGPLIERGLLRFMYGKDEIVLVLVTYSVFLILEDVITLIWGVESYSAYQPYGLLGNIDLGGLPYTVYDALLVIVAILVGVALTLVLTRTRQQLLVAVIHDREISAAMGSTSARLPRHLHRGNDARGAGRCVDRAQGVRRPGNGRGGNRACVRGGRHRRPGQPARRSIGRLHCRPGALRRRALPARGRALQHLLRHGPGADLSPQGPVQRTRGAQDMNESTERGGGSGLPVPRRRLVSRPGPEFLRPRPGKGLVVGLLLLMRCGLVSFGQGLYYCLSVRSRFDQRSSTPALDLISDAS